MLRRYFLLLLLAGLGLLLPAPHARADSYALLVGIDNYQQSDAINGLAGASNDAKALAKTLQEVSGFPADHITLLTSDGDTKPTGVAITFALDQLADEAKPGDIVFVFFSGHGIEQDGATYLIPYDADIRTDSTLRRSALPEADVRAQLSKIPARGLILAFDMCRSDPRKGEKGVARDNKLGRQAKDLVIVPSSQGAASAGPRAVVTLFSCSQDERSWEWAAKGRGYFSYYLEQGLRSAAADSKGAVRVSALISYLERAVPAAVSRQVGHQQTPYSDVEGTGAQDLVIARVSPGHAAGPPTIATFGGPEPPTETIDTRVAGAVAEGKKLLDAHEWDAAQVKYAAAVDLKPSSARAVDGLGQSYIGLRRWDEADRLFQKAASLDPTLADPVNHLAVIAFKNHKYDAAAALVKKAYALDPSSSDASLNQGYLDLLITHNFPSAERHFKKALALNAHDSSIPVALGMVSFRQGQMDLARHYLRQALEVNPKDDQAADYLGQLAQKSGDNDEAERWYTKAIGLDPTDAQPVADLAGLTHSVKHDDDTAETLFRKAMQLDPLDTSPVLGLAQMYFDNKNLDEADRYARNAQELDPKDASAAAMRTLILLSKRDFPAAETQARLSVQLDPTQGDCHLVLAAVLLARQQRDEATVEAKKAISLGDVAPNAVYQALGLNP